ncbi:MAG TPA: PLDc N-terminal domain-containing protein [Desulfovibrio sp.]|jgi:hypothetical protein|uniref:PLDc N-terminal domain-containing protein n=1 Tax=Desulfovibrio TaxID=872 RepID=UPI0004053B0C|nr:MULTISPECIES: PLDc N-terminal domain-containing protein [Desulfovibrio]MDY0306778.1 PLDc N-terminal domain-containing protein [Desulfovibrionaceae bacterium]HMM37723.1 PLDc N-terminal domain-containing protein [Desulfovibrio sp.]
MFPLPNLSNEQWIMILAPMGIFVCISLFSIWDAFRREFPSILEKMAWIQLSVLVPFLGGVAYLIFGRKRGQKIR